MGSTFVEACSLVRGAVSAAAALALPERCAGCFRPGALVCAGCLRGLAPTPVRVALADATGDGFDIWAGLPFTGPAASVLRTMKRDARPRLARHLAPALAAALGEVASAASAEPGSLVAVPVPSSRKSLRTRGFRVVDAVARRAGVHPHPLLVLRRAAADQRGLGRAERVENLRGGMRARGANGLRVVIVDDVVTTGATLVEAARALRAGGAVVVGAVTIAATPLRGRTGDASETRR